MAASADLATRSPLAATLSDLSAAGVSLFTQHQRLLRLRFSPDSGLTSESLLPHRLHGEEGLSQNYRYTLDCLAPDTRLELKTLLGQPVEIGLLLPDGGERLCTGLVTRADQVGADGGFGLFTLTLEPALALLAHRRNSRVWQDKTVPEIVAALLREHQTTHPAFRRSFTFRDATRQRYPIRSYCLQYRETDLAFLERLLAEEGIAYRYIHGPDPERSLRSADDRTDAPADDRVPAHTLVLFDDNTTLPLLTAEQTVGRTGAPRPAAIRFHRTAGVETDDALDVWHGTRQFRSGKSTLLSYDYKTVAAHVGDDDSAIAQGEAGDPASLALEDYDPQTLYYGSDPDEMARYANLRQQAKDRATKTFTGEGSVRRLIAGGWFPLADHPLHDADGEEDRQFLVTRLTFAATNNLLPKDADPFPLPADSFLAPEKETAYGATPYRAAFEAIRRPIRFVPDYSRTAHQKPTAPSGTTATVVGPEGEEIFTDEHGRIKLQFHWQRKQDHPDGGADRDERSSTWVRVAYPSAGAAWGTQYIPRIGQEVLVSFLENDIDRPVVTGVLHNGTHRPPTFSGAGRLPANKTLSGHKSKEYKGHGWNELIFDDSTGELRTRLSSEHGKTQLNQGYLIHPRTDGKGEPRGEGFELRTDESGALRVAKGLLLSAWERLKASGGQLDRDEALALMGDSLKLFEQFGDYAARHQGQETDVRPQRELRDALQRWENGSNTAQSGAGGTEGGSPAILASAPDGIALNTPKTLASYAGENADTVAQQHVQQTAGQRYTLNAGTGIGLFAHDGGLRAIAHHGELLCQSQHGNTRINASENIYATASHGSIHLMAGKEITLGVEGGAAIRIYGDRIDFLCPGTLRYKAATHLMQGPGSLATDLPAFSDEGLGRRFRLLRPTDGQPVEDTPYRIDLSDGTVREGRTNANGETDLLEDERFKIARVRFGDEIR